MKCYRIEMMTHSAYHVMMCGGYNYSCDDVKIVAQNEKQAVEKAKYYYPNMVINEGYVRECEMDYPHYDQLTIADFGITA